MAGLCYHVALLSVGQAISNTGCQVPYAFECHNLTANSVVSVQPFCPLSDKEAPAPGTSKVRAFIWFLPREFVNPMLTTESFMISGISLSSTGPAAQPWPKHVTRMPWSDRPQSSASVVHVLLPRRSHRICTCLLAWACTDTHLLLPIVSRARSQCHLHGISGTLSHQWL